jgi:hypothetical protein
MGSVSVMGITDVGDDSKVKGPPLAVASSTEILDGWQPGTQEKPAASQRNDPSSK